MADNLPTNRLDQQSHGSFLTALQGAGFSVAQEKRLLSLSIPEIRKVLSSQRKSLGEALTRRECDEVLKDLALVLPRAGLAAAEVERMLDVYFGLLKEAGVTFQMLRGAAKAFVMAPTGGKAKFFPDPGQLAEACADELKARKKAIGALERAERALIPETPSERPLDSQELRKRMHDLGEKMRVKPPQVAPVATRERPHHGEPRLSSEQVLASRNPQAVQQMREAMAKRTEAVGESA